MDIRCNVRTCRRPLSDSLWVTSCSHSFCEEHASKLKHKNVKCPACNSVLGKRYDVIRQNSNPPEEFRAMLLVGLRPEIVLDMAMRAISFWNYQVEQELKFQLASSRQLKEAVEKMKNNHSATIRQLSIVKKTSVNFEKQVENLTNSIKFLKEQLDSKDFQLQKLQQLFNSVARHSSSRPSDLQAADDFHNFMTKDNGEPLQLVQPGGKKQDFVFEPLFGTKKNNL